MVFSIAYPDAPVKIKAVHEQQTDTQQNIENKVSSVTPTNPLKNCLLNHPGYQNQLLPQGNTEENQLPQGNKEAFIDHIKNNNCFYDDVTHHHNKECFKRKQSSHLKTTRPIYVPPPSPSNSTNNSSRGNRSLTLTTSSSLINYKSEDCRILTLNPKGGIRRFNKLDKWQRILANNNNNQQHLKKRRNNNNNNYHLRSSNYHYQTTNASFLKSGRAKSVKTHLKFCTRNRSHNRFNNERVKKVNNLSISKKYNDSPLLPIKINTSDQNLTTTTSSSFYNYYHQSFIVGNNYSQSSSNEINNGDPPFKALKNLENNDRKSFLIFFKIRLLFYRYLTQVLGHFKSILKYTMDSKSRQQCRVPNTNLLREDSIYCSNKNNTEKSVGATMISARYKLPLVDERGYACKLKRFHGRRSVISSVTPQQALSNNNNNNNASKFMNGRNYLNRSSRHSFNNNSNLDKHRDHICRTTKKNTVSLLDLSNNNSTRNNTKCLKPYAIQQHRRRNEIFKDCVPDHKHNTLEVWKRHENDSRKFGIEPRMAGKFCNSSVEGSVRNNNSSTTPPPLPPLEYEGELSSGGDDVVKKSRKFVNKGGGLRRTNSCAVKKNFAVHRLIVERRNFNSPDTAPSWSDSISSSCCCPCLRDSVKSSRYYGDSSRRFNKIRDENNPFKISGLVTTTAQLCRKTVLDNVSFEVFEGEMLVLLGNKSSGIDVLMEILGNQSKSRLERTFNVFGKFRWSNKIIPSSKIKEYTCHIGPGPVLLDFLTVEEMFQLHVNLNLRNNFNIGSGYHQQVRNIMMDLKLTGISHLLVQRCNNHEKRLIQLGCQLLTNKEIILYEENYEDDFFQENHHNFVVEYLKELTVYGKIVICSLLNPSFNTFLTFTKGAIISNGCMIYYGSTRNLIPYFESIGYRAPSYTNPCDFYVDLATIDNYTSKSLLKSLKRVKVLQELCFSKCLTVLHDSLLDEISHTRIGEVVIIPNKTSSAVIVSCWDRIRVMLSLTNTSHRRINLIKAFISEMFIVIATSIIIGGIFYNLPSRRDLNLHQYTLDRSGLLFTVVFLLPFIQTVNYLESVHSDLEYFNKAFVAVYFTRMNFLAFKVLLDMLPTVLITVMLVSPLYWMSGLKQNLNNFAYFTTSLITLTQAFKVFGLTVFLLFLPKRSGITVYDRSVSYSASNPGTNFTSPQAREPPLYYYGKRSIDTIDLASASSINPYTNNSDRDYYYYPQPVLSSRDVTRFYAYLYPVLAILLFYGATYGFVINYCQLSKGYMRWTKTFLIINHVNPVNESSRHRNNILNYHQFATISPFGAIYRNLLRAELDSLEARAIKKMLRDPYNLNVTHLIAAERNNNMKPSSSHKDRGKNFPNPGESDECKTRWHISEFPVKVNGILIIKNMTITKINACPKINLYSYLFGTEPSNFGYNQSNINVKHTNNNQQFRAPYDTKTIQNWTDPYYGDLLWLVYFSIVCLSISFLRIYISDHA